LDVNGLNTKKPAIPDHALVRLIGRGSYGEVWLARNVTGAYRAVKVIYRQRFDDAKPFEREFNGILRYEPLSRSHDSQVDILHVGRNDDAGCFYYVMELADDQVHGQHIDPETYRPRTLRSEIHQRQRLPLGACLQIGLSLTTALSHLHQHGLVHRDVKPSNIVFINGIPKLADVGLIATTEDTHSFVGTEGYLPPEGPGQPQADLYALGKVIYEICMGRDRKEFPELPTDFLEYPDQEGLREFNEIIIKACHPDPCQRYQTAEEMHADLAMLQGGKSVIGSRNMERRLILAKRYGRILAVFALVALAAYYHTNRTKQQIAQQLVRFQVAQGVQLIEHQHFSESLPWFAEAAFLSPNDREIHRLRFGLIAGQSPRLTQLFPHRRPINDVQFSSDGRLVVTASDDGNARVWDLYTGRPRTQWLRHQNEVRSVRFSPDNKYVLTASNDRTACLWELATGNRMGVPMEHGDQVNEAVFSPNGSLLLTASLDGTARLWEAGSAKPVGPPLAHQQPVWHAAFSPDGQFFLTLYGPNTLPRKEGHVQLWRWTGTSAVEGLEISDSQVLHAAFSPDGSKIATGGSDHQVKVWSLATGKPIEFARVHTGAVDWVAFSPDGRRLVSASLDQTARVWDVATGQPLGREFKNHGPVTQAQFSPDGRWIATAAEDSTALVFDAATGELVFSGLAHGSWVNKITFDTSGFLLATASADTVARVWKLVPPQAQQFILSHAQPVQTAVISPDGRFVVTAYGAFDGPGKIRVWNALTHRQVLEWTGHRGPIVSLALSEDGQRLLSASRDGTARVWDMLRGQSLTRPMDHRWPLSQAVFSPDGRWVATASGVGGKHGEARIWDAKTGIPITRVLPHDDEVMSAMFSPDNRQLVTASGSLSGLGEARVWEIDTEQLAIPPLKHAAPVSFACFSPDGQKVATASMDHSARIWNPFNGSAITPPLKHGGQVVRVAFSPDSKRIVTLSKDKTARIWNASTGDPISLPLSHQDEVINAAFSSDGNLLVTASSDHTARVWSALTGEALTPNLRHDGPVVFAAFDPERQYVLTASHDHTARLWPLEVDHRPIQDLLSIAHLLSGQKIHLQGGWVPLKPDEMCATLKQLQSKYPAEFLLSRQDLLEWHQRQADLCERSQEWTAAQFHLDRWMTLKPAGPELQKRLSRITWSGAQNDDSGE
jgi:WD40 repeat protein